MFFRLHYLASLIAVRVCGGVMDPGKHPTLGGSELRVQGKNWKEKREKKLTPWNTGVALEPPLSARVKLSALQGSGLSTCACRLPSWVRGQQ